MVLIVWFRCFLFRYSSLRRRCLWVLARIGSWGEREGTLLAEGARIYIIMRKFGAQWFYYDDVDRPAAPLPIFVSGSLGAR